ncbi:MAG: recombination-associated protein RdgC, partial [Rhodanobacteraceae bacterium]
MFFRNLTLFRFAEKLPRSLKHLPSALDEHRLRPAGPMELATRGFVSPFGRESEELTHQIGAFILTTIGGEDRLLPSVVVNEELAQKVRKIVEKEDRRVGAKERKQLKEAVISELMPRAFIRPSRLNAYLDGENGWLVIDTASRKAAEEAVDQFRTAMGRFPAVPAAPEN